MVLDRAKMRNLGGAGLTSRPKALMGTGTPTACRVGAARTVKGRSARSAEVKSFMAEKNIQIKPKIYCEMTDTSGQNPNL
jgi:hypothetical protein